jgi:hypothetical protein
MRKKPKKLFKKFLKGLTCFGGVCHYAVGIFAFLEAMFSDFFIPILALFNKRLTFNF